VIKWCDYNSRAAAIFIFQHISCVFFYIRFERGEHASWSSSLGVAGRSGEGHNFYNLRWNKWNYNTCSVCNAVTVRPNHSACNCSCIQTSSSFPNPRVCIRSQKRWIRYDIVKQPMARLRCCRLFARGSDRVGHLSMSYHLKKEIKPVSESLVFEKTER
jgi:hypothetical protein